MLVKTVLSGILLYQLAFAVSNDAGKSIETHDEMSPKALRSRLEVTGEIFQFDEKGEKLTVQAHEARRWRLAGDHGKIKSFWSTTSNLYAPIFLHHTWEVREDGTIKAVVEQYSEFEKVAQPKNDETHQGVGLLKREEYVIRDFSPIVWRSVSEKKKRTIVRFIPMLAPSKSYVDFKEFPFAGTDLLVRDSDGNVWADHMGVSGKYAGFITHRGALFLSFYPFKGSKEMGTARGREVELDLGNKKIVTLVSSTSFFPEGMQGKVYAVYRPDRKTERLNSKRVISDDEEKEFLEKISEAE